MQTESCLKRKPRTAVESTFQPHVTTGTGHVELTVELGLGENAAADAEAFLAIRHIESGDRRMVRYLEHANSSTTE